MCATSAATITVPFTSSGTVGTYAVQLSDASGSFASPATLATSGSASPLTAAVPAGTASGTGYKVRVINSSPLTIGTANPTAFVIVSNPTVSIAPTATQNLTAGANGTTLTATESPAATSRQWVSTTSGSPYSAISGATGTTYTPNFATAGTYYVAVQSTFAACGTVISNEVQVNVTPTPTLTVTPASLSGFSTPLGTPSFAQSYVLTGSNLTSAATVTAPTGYAVSLDNGTYTSTLSAPANYVNGSGITIYVRLTGATAGTPSGNVTNAATGAVTANVAVSGSVAGLAVSPSSLAAFNTLAGSPSANRTYTLTGSGLTNNVTVTAPTGYEVSLSGTAGTFAATQTVTPSGGSISQTIYVRLTGATAGTFSGNVSNASPPAATQNVAVTGTVVGKPTGTPAVAAGAPTYNSVTLNLTPAADGTNLLVVVRPASSPATAPTDQTTYTGNATYGSGAPLGGGKVVYAAANTTSVTVTGLTGSTAYAADVYTYNVGTTGGFESYGASSGTTSFTTTAAPVVLLSYQFPGGTTGTAGGSPAPTTTNANVTGSNFTRNLLTDAMTANVFSSTGFSAAFDATRSLEFTVSPNAGYQITLQTLDLGDQRSGTGPTQFELRSSLDSYAATIDGVRTSVTAIATPPAVNETFNLGTAFANLTAPVTFRLYAYNPGTGTFRVDNVNLNGYVAPNTTPSLTASPSTLNLSAVNGQTTTGTYTLNGTNLGAGAAVSVSSGSPAVLLSTGGAYSQTLALTASAGGSLSQAISVQYTAPATAGTATVTISNTSGSLSAPVTVNTTAVTPATYAWNGTASTSYSDASNWTPARTTPAATDVLTFNGSTVAAPTVALDYSSSQTIGQLLLTNGVAATFTTDGNRTLVIDNNLSGDDFTISATSSLTLLSTTTATGIVISLTAPETATIAGTLVFNGTSGSVLGRHSLNSAAANAGGTAAGSAIQFVSGSKFQQGLYFDTSTSNSAFGEGTSTPTRGTLNSVGFRNGSVLEQTGGSNAFGQTAPNSFFVAEPLANYLYDNPSNASSPSLSNRTYGSLEYNTPSASANIANATGSTLKILGNLTITQGTVGLNLTGGISIGGNIAVNGTATLSFTPATSGTVSLNGTTAQTIGGSSTAATPIAFNNGASGNVTLQLNNAAGVTLALPVPLAGTLQLTSGLLTTTATSYLTLASGASYSGGSANSFVNGPLRRTVPAVGTATTVDFPIGKGTAYRPLSLAIQQQSGTTTFQAEQLEQSGGSSLANPDPSGAPLARVSQVRYFTVTPYNASGTTITQPSGFLGSAVLSFGADDQVTDPTTLTVGKRDLGNPWFNILRQSSTGTASGGTITSGPFTSFSDFALASTDPDRTNNPLPVELTAFTATRSADQGVCLAWTTASEKNSARFEVERSLDGKTFEVVASVRAQGSSAQAHTYATRDAGAPASLLYYRLRQVDQDGKATYSPTVTVAAGPAGELTLSPNPAQSQLSWLTEQASVYAVRNALGQQVLAGTTAAGTLTTLDVSRLPGGVYLLELHSAAGRVVRRFVKE